MSNSQYPEGLKDTFLCLVGVNAWPYTKVVSVKDDGTPVLETQCIKKSSYEAQTGNVVDTASNAAQAKYMTGAQGATVAAGTAALAGGTSFLSFTKAMLQQDYFYFKNNHGRHKPFFNEKIDKCVAKLDWDKYDDFDSALKGEGTKCNFFKAL